MKFILILISSLFLSLGIVFILRPEFSSNIPATCFSISLLSLLILIEMWVEEIVEAIKNK